MLVCERACIAFKIGVHPVCEAIELVSYIYLRQRVYVLWEYVFVCVCSIADAYTNVCTGRTVQSTVRHWTHTNTLTTAHTASESEWASARAAKVYKFIILSSHPIRTMVPQFALENCFFPSIYIQTHTHTYTCTHQSILSQHTYNEDLLSVLVTVFFLP